MKAFKKIMALALMGVMSLSVVACGGKSGDNRKPGGYDPTEKGEDGWAYNDTVDETVTEIEIFKNDWAVFNNARSANSPVYSKIKSEVGFDIKAMNSSSNWQQQLGLMQAEGEMPDIFLTEGPEESEFFNSLIQNGDIIAISDWVSEATYPNIYNYMKKFEYMRSNISYAGGKSWYIPSSWANEKSLYVRQDWIDNLNNKLASVLVKEGVIASESDMTEEIEKKWKFGAPKDLLEFYRLARAFTLYDPDSNGTDDTTGYMSESNKDMDAWVYMAFDTGWCQFVKDGDSYVYSDVTEGSMYATAYITRLITDGYMSLDSLTADNGTKQDRFSQGKAGMIYAHNWLNNFLSAIMSVTKCSIEEARSKVLMCDPPAGKNGAWNGAGQDLSWQGFCINANMSNSRIRACLDLYEYLLSDEGYQLLQYGVEGEHYEVDAQGNKTSLLQRNPEGFYLSIVSADPATMLYALVDWTMHYRSTVQSNADIIVPRQERSEANSYKSDYPALYTEASIDYLADCHSLFEETVALLEKNEKGLYMQKTANYNPTTFGWDQLYTVSAVFQNKWKSMVKNYKEYGGTVIFEEYNDYIASGKAVKVTK